MIRIGGGRIPYPDVAVYPRSGGGAIFLGGRLTGYEHTIADQVGFETLRASFNCKPQEAITWLGRLRATIVASDADGMTCWEGYVSQVDVSVGGRARSIGLDAMANRVRVRYPLRGLNSPQVTASASNSTSVAAFGTKDAVVSVGATDSTAAIAARDAYLAAYAMPRAQPSISLAAGRGEDAGGATVTITGAGWYTTLGWVLTARTDTSAESTTTQVGDLISSSGVGIGVTNPGLVSTSTAKIASSGVSDTRAIAADTSYQAKIEALLSKGRSAGALSWGVYENRVLAVVAWSVSATYQISQGSALVRSGMRVIPPWQVRPAAVVQDSDVTGLVALSTVDTGGQFALARTAFRAGSDGWSLDLEPGAANDIDARIARLT
jgi:hypothetical protein